MLPKRKDRTILLGKQWIKKVCVGSRLMPQEVKISEDKGNK